MEERLVDEKEALSEGESSSLFNNSQISGLIEAQKDLRESLLTVATFSLAPVLSLC